MEGVVDRTPYYIEFYIQFIQTSVQSPPALSFFFLTKTGRQNLTHVKLLGVTYMVGCKQKMYILPIAVFFLTAGGFFSPFDRSSWRSQCILFCELTTSQKKLLAVKKKLLVVKKTLPAVTISHHKQQNVKFLFAPTYIL